MSKRKRAAKKWLKAIDEPTTSKANAIDEPTTSKANAKDNDNRVDSDIRIEENSQEIGNQVIQMEANSKNNDARIQENVEAVDEETVQVDEDFEVDVIERTTRDATANPVVKHKCRGPTKVKRLPVNPLGRIEVEFDADGKPIGDGSVKLSSYLGPLVREHVPVTLDKWKKLSEVLQVALWGCIQVRFKLDDEWQKACIFQQMGCIFRSSKARLVRKIADARNEEERIQLKPDNLSMNEWKKFLKSKTTPEFKELSQKFKAIRNNQIPHTCSRKGMARVADDLKKTSPHSSSVSRAHVWIKSHTRKNGEPVNVTAADAIEKIKQIDNESNSSSTTNYKEDALAKVLGHDRPGRLRGMGRGMTYTKAIWSHVRDKQTVDMQSKISELDAMVRMLVKNQRKESWDEASVPQVIKHDKKYDTCDLLDWSETDEIVAEGRVVSSDPKELVQQIPLGSDAKKIIIDTVRKPDAFLWRPSLYLTHVGEVEGEIVAWPATRVVLRNVDNFEKEDIASKSSSTDKKCKLIDWSGSEELVAEGRLHSSDPKQLVNDLPLGPAAVAVWIDNPKVKDAFLWRPTKGLTRVGEAVGIKVAWLESKVVIETVSTALSDNDTSNVGVVEKSTNSTANGKCKLSNWSGKGEIVALGRVSSTDPTAMVHCVPLGKNAIKVWIDIVKIPKAHLWRTTSDLEVIEDALGTTIAWPAANVIME